MGFVFDTWVVIKVQVVLDISYTTDARQVLR